MNRCYLCDRDIQPNHLNWTRGGFDVCSDCFNANKYTEEKDEDTDPEIEFDLDTQTPVIVSKPVKQKVRVKCSNCRGTGWIWQMYIGRAKCSNCDGSGEVENEKEAA